MNESLTKLIPAVFIPVDYIQPSVQHLIIPNGICNSPNITVLNLSRFPELRAIEIGDYCFTSVTKFVINGLSKLNSLRIGSFSFSSDNIHKSFYEFIMPGFFHKEPRSFHVVNCTSLQTIDISDYSFSDYGFQFELRKLPSLQSLKIGKHEQFSNNFVDCSFEIRCNDTIGKMNNSSSKIEDHYIA